MADKSERDLGLRDTPNPADFPIGSPESRAAARRFLHSGSARIIKAYCVEASERDADGGAIGPPRECDPMGATLKGFNAPHMEYRRGDDETAAEFESRVFDSVPVAGPPGSNEFFYWIIEMHPRKAPPNQAA
jgi:hypothetical protein